MTKTSLAALLFALTVFLHPASPVVAQRVPTLGAFEIEQIKFTGGEYKDELFRYLVLAPHDGYKAGQKYPLIFFLHGAGERGNDPKKLLPHFPTQMAKPEWRKKFPCIVVVPQCRNGKQWVNAPWGDKLFTPLAEKPSDNLQMAIAVLEKSLKTLPVDKNRVYLTGLSMGGYGSWELAMRRPELFAAVAPVCGGGDETQAAKLKNIPIWAAHGDADRVVWPIRSRNMYEAIKQAGGSIKYTEYTGVGHNSWTQFYADAKGVVPWMMEQKRNSR
jgi:predicted peptidase